MTTAPDERPAGAPDSVIFLAAGDLLSFMTGGEAEGRGWAAYFPKGGDVPVAFVRLLPDDPDSDHPHYDVAELYMHSPMGVTGRVVRGLPLGRIEAAANHPINATRMRQLAASRAGNMGLAFKFDLDELIRRRADPRAEAVAFSAPVKERRPNMRVKVPVGNRKPDSFYEQIAYRYGWLQGEGVRVPAEQLAEANNVPVTTVHRWVKEARRRGLMAPGQRASRRDTQ